MCFSGSEREIVACWNSGAEPRMLSCVYVYVCVCVGGGDPSNIKLKFNDMEGGSCYCMSILKKAIAPCLRLMSLCQF